MSANFDSEMANDALFEFVCELNEALAEKVGILLKSKCAFPKGSQRQERIWSAPVYRVLSSLSDSREALGLARNSLRVLQTLSSLVVFRELFLSEGSLVGAARALGISKNGVYAQFTTVGVSPKDVKRDAFGAWRKSKPFVALFQQIEKILSCTARRDITSTPLESPIAVDLTVQSSEIATSTLVNVSIVSMG